MPRALKAPARHSVASCNLLASSSSENDPFESRFSLYVFQLACQNLPQQSRNLPVECPILRLSGNYQVCVGSVLEVIDGDILKILISEDPMEHARSPVCVRSRERGVPPIEQVELDGDNVAFTDRLQLMV